MRSRSRLIIPTVAAVGALVLGPLSAHADTPGHGAVVTAATASAASVGSVTSAGRIAVLPTGERVWLTGTAGHERVTVSHRAASGPGRTLMVQRSGQHVYVFPAVAERYLGHGLDRALFDVTSLPSHQTGNKLRIVLHYTGAAPSVPGVRITSTSTGTAHGYLTRSGSAAFGKALAAGWLVNRSTPFAHVSSIALDAAHEKPVKAAFVMYTLILKVIGSDGKPLPEGEVTVMNVDSGARYSDWANVEDGEARISVPAGHYSLIGDEFVYDEDTDTGSVHIVTVDPYAVSGSDQTVTLDARTATVRPQVHTPKPASVTDYIFELDRVDAKESYGSSDGYLLDGGVEVFLTPQPAVTRGTFAFEEAWSLDSAAGVTPAYHYDLAALDDHIAANLSTTFAASQLATVNASYYGDGSTAPGGFSRTALYDEAGGFGSFDRIKRGTARTEYVGAAGGDAIWTETGLFNYDADDDPGFVDGPFDEIPAGTTRTAEWFRGPIVAAVPSPSKFDYCLACRNDGKMVIAVEPVTDSDPSHSAQMFGAEDGLPVTRFRLYRGHTLVEDHDDYFGTLTKVTKKKARYTAKIDVDRRLVDPVQSTQTRTVYKFTTKAGTGKKLSKHDVCPLKGCRVLPIVAAHVTLPTDLQGRLPAGKTAVTVRVARLSGATPSAAASAALAFRPAGYWWSSVKMTANGDGTFTGVIDNTDLEGSLVDLRVRGTDKAGSTFSQTIVRAYTVASA